MAVHFHDSDHSMFQREAWKALNSQPTFHWPLEFPEVMLGRGGFDVIVCNPPYLGGRKIRGTLGGRYLDFLTQSLVPGASANADLCAFFVRRGHSVTRDSIGINGFVSTSSMSEGDTREVCLEALCRSGSHIIRASSKSNWPGSASVTFTPLWIRKGQWHGEFVLDEKIVSGINSYLVEPEDLDNPPSKLKKNYSLAFRVQFHLVKGLSLLQKKPLIL